MDLEEFGGQSELPNWKLCLRGLQLYYCAYGDLVEDLVWKDEQGGREGRQWEGSCVVAVIDGGQNRVDEAHPWQRSGSCLPVR